jgi:hypothetical protein
MWKKKRTSHISPLGRAVLKEINCCDGVENRKRKYVCVSWPKHQTDADERERKSFSLLGAFSVSVKICKQTKRLHGKREREGDKQQTLNM